MAKSAKYSETCLYNHLYKTTMTTNAVSTQANSHTTVTVSDDHLSKAAITNYLFCLPNQTKPCLKQPLQTFVQRRNGKQFTKNKFPSNCIYSAATLKCKVYLML